MYNREITPVSFNYIHCIQLESLLPDLIDMLQETKTAEEMVGMIHQAGDEDGEEEFIKVPKFQLNKQQVKDLNKAFLEDMKKFKPNQADESSVHSGNITSNSQNSLITFPIDFDLHFFVYLYAYGCCCADRSSKLVQYIVVDFYLIFFCNVNYATSLL